MADHETKRLSKYLSLVLRHDPGAAGVELDPAGWVGIDRLMAGAASRGQTFSRADLDHVVTTSDKRRFTLSDDGARIRAAQGHSVLVDLGLVAVAPPETLFHGTAATRLDAILAEGLRPQSRLHVHLSPDAETARRVGQRHGRPRILLVAAGAAHREGQTFFQADNGVWLTGPVAPAYLTLLQETP